MLKPGVEIVSKGDVVERVILNRRETRIGRKDDNDIVLSNVSVSRHHAKITDEGGQFQIWDLGSANGVLINAKKIDVKAPIKLGDELGIGKFILRFLELDPARDDVRSGPTQEDGPATSGSAIDAAGESARRRREPTGHGLGPEDTHIKAGPDQDSASTLPPPRPLPAGEARRVLCVFEGKELTFEKPIEHVPFAIGRASDNDLILNKAGVSRYHAVIHRDGARFTIEDLGSRNGTFVNGEKVKSSVLAVDDEIRIGDFRILLGVGSAPGVAGEVVAAEVVESSAPDISFENSTGGRTMVASAAAMRGDLAREAPAAEPASEATFEPGGGTRFEFPVKEVVVSIQYLGWSTTTRFTPDAFQRAEGPDAARDLVTVRLEMGDRTLSRTLPVASLDLEKGAKR